MAIGLTHMSLERKLTANIGQLLLQVPITVYDKKFPSHETFKKPPVLSAEASEWMHNSFIPDVLSNNVGFGHIGAER